MLSVWIFLHFSLNRYFNFFEKKYSHHGDNRFFLSNFNLKDFFLFETNFSKTKFGGQAFALRQKILTRATSLTPLM